MSQQVPPSNPTSMAPIRRRRYGRWLVASLVVLMLAGIWQRERLWIWYCSERLVRADDEHRGEWGDKLADVGEPAIPVLLQCFRHDEPGVNLAGRHALEKMFNDCPAGDPRLAAFATQFNEAEPLFSTPGRSAAMELLPLFITKQTPGMLDKAHAMIQTASKSDSVDVRIQAVAMAMRPDVDALASVVALLSDSAPEVRRAAILALGPITRPDRVAASDDDLLKLLHDSDSEVRRLCEMSLRSRGRSPRDIRLAKRYTAPNPAERQKLLLDLADDEERDLSVWLERLTADADPAVRAGAIRVAAERQVDLASRMEQMRRNDPDGTVRRIADYYRSRMPNER